MSRRVLGSEMRSGPGPGAVECERRYRFAAGAPAVWAAMCAVGQYRTWWPWLRGFEATELAAGARWSCVIRPPAPYLLRFTLVLDEVEAPRRIVAHVQGDVTGEARLVLADSVSKCATVGPRGRRGGSPSPAGAPATEGCCEVVLTSSLRPARGALRLVAATLPGVGRYGHARVLDKGARQFAAALSAFAADGAGAALR